MKGLAGTCLFLVAVAVYASGDGGSSAGVIRLPDNLCTDRFDECQTLIDEAVSDGDAVALCFGFGRSSISDIGIQWALTLPLQDLDIGEACVSPADANSQPGFVRAIVSNAQVSFELPEVTALARFLTLRASPNAEDRAEAWDLIGVGLQDLVARDEYVACTASAPIESIVEVLSVKLDKQGVWTEVTVTVAIWDRFDIGVIEMSPATYLIRPVEFGFEGGEAGLSCLPTEF